MSPLAARDSRRCSAPPARSAGRGRRTPAGLPFASVDPERDLEVAALALAVGEVVEGRPPLRDGLPEHRHGPTPPPAPSARPRSAPPTGPDGRPRGKAPPWHRCSPRPPRCAASIRKLLTGPRRPAAALARKPPQNPGSRGSTPRWEKWGSLRIRRGRQRRRPARTAADRAAAAAGRIPGRRPRARGAPEASPAGTTVSRPLIPRWTTRVCPPSRSISRYFDRRRSAVDGPASRPAEPAARRLTGSRSAGFRTSTRVDPVAQEMRLQAAAQDFDLGSSGMAGDCNPLTSSTFWRKLSVTCRDKPYSPSFPR